METIWAFVLGQKLCCKYYK